MRGKKKSTLTEEHTQHEPQEEYSKLLREMSSTSHKRQILEYMMKYGSITQAEAVAQFDCYRLSARIAELRDMDIEIITTLEENKNRPGQHARYFL